MAKRDGETLPEWDWVESTVWTEGMLKALQRGVQGGTWYSLIDKVYRRKTLRAAWKRVKANKGSSGVDHVTIERFESNLERELDRLSQQLCEGTYRPQAVKRVYIPKPGSAKGRPLGIPTVRDRVVQTALRMVLEPIFEKDFAEHSYGFRPQRGCKDALRRVDALLKQGYLYVVDADLKSYFDTISKTRLMDLVQDKVTDGRILALLNAYLEQEVMDTTSSWTPERGTPQGAVISPLLANIYLDPLDHLMAEKGFEMVRYADDFVILCRSRKDAERALEVVQQWTQRAELTLHPDKTHIAHTIDEGFEFLGYRFAKGERWPRDKSLKKIKDTIRDKTKKTNGHSMQTIIADLNRTLRGWYEYYKQCKWYIFDRLDRFIRRRLRSILRKRMRLKGSSHGNRSDQQRWTNAYFAEMGLLSLKATYMNERQPAWR